MIATTGAALVLGVGNVLLGDDGVGIRLVDELRRLAACDPAALPPGTRLVDAGALGLDLLSTVHGARSLLLLDAVNLDQPIGTVSVRRGGDIAAASGCGAGSDPGSIGGFLATARLLGWLPDRVALVGVQVTEARPGIGLSPLVEAAVPGAVLAALAELHALDECVAAGRSTTPAIRHQEEATA
jgi:hydrogenase maturation protease